jgi:hypothetical protein
MSGQPYAILNGTANWGRAFIRNHDEETWNRLFPTQIKQNLDHQRQDPAVFPVNFAEGLPLYFRDHDGNPMPVGGIKVEGDTVAATGDTVQHIGK